MKMTDESALAAIERAAQIAGLREVHDYLSVRLAADQQKANIPDLSNWAQHYSVNETAVQALRSILGDQQKGDGESDDTVFIQQTRCYPGDEWFREMTVEGVQFLVPLDQQDQARFILSAKKRRTTPQPSIPAPAQQGGKASGGDDSYLNVVNDLRYSAKVDSYSPQQTSFINSIANRVSLLGTAPAIAQQVVDEAMVMRAHDAIWANDYPQSTDAIRAALVAALAHPPHADQDQQP